MSTFWSECFFAAGFWADAFWDQPRHIGPKSEPETPAQYAFTPTRSIFALSFPDRLAMTEGSKRVFVRTVENTLVLED